MSTKEGIINNEVDAIVHFVCEMDIEMLDELLDPKQTYQEMEKYMFLNKLQQSFRRFRELEDEYLEKYPGRCTGCNTTKSGFTFVGNVSRAHMNLIFVETEGKVCDIYECSSFCRHTTLTTIGKREICIDDDRTPF